MTLSVLYSVTRHIAHLSNGAISNNHAYGSKSAGGPGSQVLDRHLIACIVIQDGFRGEVGS